MTPNKPGSPIVLHWGIFRAKLMTASRRQLAYVSTLWGGKVEKMKNEKVKKVGDFLFCLCAVLTFVLASLALVVMPGCSMSNDKNPASIPIPSALEHGSHKGATQPGDYIGPADQSDLSPEEVINFGPTLNRNPSSPFDYEAYRAERAMDAIEKGKVPEPEPGAPTVDNPASGVAPETSPWED
jgi:hypothetical protein